MIIFKWSKSPLAALSSIPIAGYWSIRRLAIGDLSSLNIDHLFNANGINVDNGLNYIGFIKNKDLLCQNKVQGVM